MDIEYLTVSQINAYINKKLKMDVNLRNIYIKGEISNYKTYPTGHSYFTLKDKTSQIKAVMFKGNKRFLKFKPENGMNVIIKGKIEIFEKNGQHQLYATRIIEDGIGELHISFEQLKKKLKKEGLFADSHKKKIPKYPQKIGVITAETGAAIRDIITTIKRRYPICEILVFSTLVQGDSAAPEIIKQIKHAQKYDLDTIIIGRGGGSIEDLWPFNEESVAREIYNCKIPVISAVGHEIDYTIADFVSDLRAPTPTAAAELAVPNINELKNRLNQIVFTTNKVLTNKINENKIKIKHISEKQILKNPETIYEIKAMNLDNLINKLELSSKNIITINKQKLENLKNSFILKHPHEITKRKKESYLRKIEKLEVLNPLLTLKRGYSITKGNDKVITSINDVNIGDKLEIELQDGKINAKVIK